MRNTPLWAACAAGFLILGFSVFTASTQETEDPAAETAVVQQAIGLVDVGYLFKHYPRFTVGLAEMKTDLQNAEAEVNKKKEAMQSMQRQLQLLVVGTSEYTELERRITVAQAELAGDVANQKRAFLRREARLYYDVYQEIAEEVEGHAGENNIAVVLRFSDDPVDVNEPKDVLRQVNRPVVWHDRGRDLTRIILQRLSRRPEPPADGEIAPLEDPKEPIPEAPADPT